MRVGNRGKMFTRGLVVAILFLGGAILGDRFGAMCAEYEDEREMNIYADTLIDLGRRVTASARKTLDDANQSPYSPCSHEDEVYLRRLVFGGYQIKDIGRVKDGILLCSILLHDVRARTIMSKPDVVMEDGTEVFGDRALITPGSHGPIMIKGSVNLVIGSSAFDPVQADQYKFAVFLVSPDRDRAALLFSFPETGDHSIQLRSARTLFNRTAQGSELYRCDAERVICVSLTRDVVSDQNPFLSEHNVGRVLGFTFGCALCLGFIAIQRRDRSLDFRLRRALDDGRLDVFYQPIMKLADQQPAGFEALLRWEIRPTEFVPPDVFVGVAEQHGYSNKLAQYVRDAVIRDFCSVLKLYPDLRITINLTATEMESPGFLSAFAEKFSRAGIRPQQIGIELTERTAVDIVKAKEGMAHMRRLGYQIYIDDFGTGYSSLAYLGNMEVDAIKIDKIFTRTVGASEVSISIVPQIVTMARKYGLSIVVEGLETAEQVSYFARYKPAVQGQGWYYSPALPAREAIAFLEEKALQPALSRKKQSAHSPIRLGTDA